MLPDMIGRCRDLEQFYGPDRALAGVDLELAPGATGLLGANGAGKTTLLKSLLGHLPLAPGRVELFGLDPARRPLAVRQRLGFVPERDLYLPGLTGLEQVTFLGQLSGLRRSDALARAHDMLHLVGLGEARYREVDGYSTGMRQRVKLAGALVHGPELLLLDEPTSGLDPAGRDEVLALIAELAGERGLSVLLSSHILQDIERTCQQLVVLHQGRVRYAGTLAGFQQRGRQLIEVRVKHGRRRLAAALEQAGCQVAAPAGAAGLEVELPAGGEPQLIWRLAREQGLQLRHLAPATASLSEAFGRSLAEPPAEVES